MQKSDSKAIQSPDQRLINSDPILSSFITHSEFPRYAASAYLGFRSMVNHGHVVRVSLANTVLLFVYVCTREGRTEIAPRDLVKYCRMSPQTSRDIMLRALSHGYIRRIRTGVYRLTDEGRELYITLIDSLINELTGPFRWRP